MAGLVSCALACGALHALPVRAEESLGRLFFTPERRQQLDRQREQKALPERETKEVPTLMKVDGVVTRSSGRRTVWINGVAYSEKDAPDDVSVTPRRSDAARVLVQPGRAPTIHVRVGETVNRDTGETEPLLGEGAVLRHRRAPGR